VTWIDGTGYVVSLLDGVNGGRRNLLARIRPIAAPLCAAGRSAGGVCGQSLSTGSGVPLLLHDHNQRLILGIDVPVPSDTWHSLGIDFRTSRFSVSFNGKRVFEVDDATFTDAGKVGLWTKADSITLFDDVTYGEAE
jgi:hypothetical protein